MKKRQLKKLARRGVDELKAMKVPAPLSTKKIQNALFLYLHRVESTIREPKLYREFWQTFNKLGGWDK